MSQFKFFFFPLGHMQEMEKGTQSAQLAQVSSLSYSQGSML